MDGLDEMDRQDKQTGDGKINRREEGGKRGRGGGGKEEEEWAGQWMDEQMNA